MLWRYRLHLVDAEARLLLARGDAPAALRAAEGELAGARAHGARKLEARALELRGRALLTLDERPEAEAALREAAALAEAIGYPPVGWRAWALAGELARREGDAAGAARAAARVRAATERTAGALQDADLARELLTLGARLAEDPLRRPAFWRSTLCRIACSSRRSRTAASRSSTSGIGMPRRHLDGFREPQGVVFPATSRGRSS